MSDNAQNNLFREAGLVFEPLSSIDSAYRITALFRRLGYDLPDVDDASGFADLASRIENIIQILIKFDQAPEDKKPEIIAELIPELTKLTEKIVVLKNEVESITSSVPDFAANAPLEELPERLIDYLIIEYSRNYRSSFHAAMNLLGVFGVEDLPENEDKFQPLTSLKVIRWDRLPKVVSDPAGLFDEVYKWESDFDSNLFFTKLDAVIRAFLLPGGLYDQSTTLKEALGNTAGDLKELRFPVLQNAIYPSTYGQFGINITGVDARNSKKAGFAIVPYMHGESEFDFDLSEDFEIEFESTVSVDAGMGVIIRPGSIDYLTTLFDNPEEAGNLNAGLTLQQKESSGEIVLIGNSEASRLALEGIAMRVFIQHDSTRDLGGELNLDAIRLVVSGEEGDGFLSKIMGEGITAEGGLTVGLSAQSGFYFSGKAGLEIEIPTHISLGPLEVQGLLIGLNIEETDFNLDGGATVKTKLGPIAAVVENMGLRGTLTFPDNGGNLGPANMEVAFKPPNGVGLSVDAGPVKGGGYLFFDVDREEYAGALELVFSDWIALKAIGLITTKMPDGSKGFSMLLIFTAEFGTGIQLGFGFTLNSVGGLLGINRIVSIDPLKDGIRTGAVDSIMFPKNVVENAPRIISDLRKFFPPQNDSFLLGPMAKIGWGTPTLIDISIGIVLEIPSVDITILGVIKVILPDEKADVLRLQVNFIGRIEPSNQRLWFYAELFDSRVLFITLEGGMGLLVNWGDNANFVASAGGFHPRYSPPPLPFPEPPRISAMLLNENNAKVRIEGYFAVTSNTVQFGARSKLFFGTSDFKIEGHHAFDALFQFDPFFFSFSLSISLSVKVFGVGMFSVGFSGILEGPTPWYIEGKGKISLLFFKIKVPFSHTWGEEEDTKLDPVAIFPLLEKELNVLTNWQARLPESSSNLVSLRELGDSEEDQLVLHPVGTLRISQRKVPLNFKLDRLGNQRPSDVHKLEVEAALNGVGNLAASKIKEQFAIGQYKDLDDSGRLSSPAFEPLDGGLEVAVEGHQIKTSQAIKRIIRYESIIIDSYYKRFVEPFYNFLTNGLSLLHETLHKHFLAGSAVSKSVLSNQHKKRMQPFDEVIEVKPHEYSVAFNTDNKPLNGEATTFTSQAEAKEYMEQKIQNDPKVADKLHVIPNIEINTAA